MLVMRMCGGGEVWGVNAFEAACRAVQKADDSERGVGNQLGNKVKVAPKKKKRAGQTRRLPAVEAGGELASSGLGGPFAPSPVSSDTDDGRAAESVFSTLLTLETEARRAAAAVSERREVGLAGLLLLVEERRSEGWTSRPFWKRARRSVQVEVGGGLDIVLF